MLHELVQYILTHQRSRGEAPNCDVGERGFSRRGRLGTLFRNGEQGQVDRTACIYSHPFYSTTCGCNCLELGSTAWFNRGCYRKCRYLCSDWFDCRSDPATLPAPSNFQLRL